jgi:Na+/melibiose symporter-like transporter
VNTPARHLQYAAYGLLGLPLAMAALPVYVQIPAYYATQLGVALASIGWVLFLARFVDALQDPLIGYVIDRLPRVQLWFWCGAILLSAAFAGLWLPPDFVNKLAWLALMLIVAYVAHSMLNIAYLSWGARLGVRDSAALLGGSAYREAGGLIGVILASVLPGLIFVSADSVTWLRSYCLAFALIAALAVYVLLNRAPAWPRVASRSQQSMAAQWRIVFSNRAFNALLLPYFINAISVAVPATLVLFFINDRLQAAHYAPAFLATYFLAAAIGLPLWVRLARHIGVSRAWRIGMVMAILAFMYASVLGAGQVGAFFVICIASGLALGADLALPPVLLAHIIERDAAPSAYFGFWTLLGKLALAVSGLALPVLDRLDYHPGQSAGAQLAWIYAGVPCILKCIALLLLLRVAPVQLEKVA